MYIGRPWKKPSDQRNFYNQDVLCILILYILYICLGAERKFGVCIYIYISSQNTLQVLLIWIFNFLYSGTVLEVVHLHLLDKWAFL